MMDLMFIYPISHISDFIIRSIRKKNLISSYFLNMMFVFEKKMKKKLKVKILFTNTRCLRQCHHLRHK